MLSPFWDPTRKFDFPQCQLQDKYRTPVISTQIWNTIHFGAELTNTGFYPRQMLNSDLTNTDNSGWTNTDNCPQNPITVPKPLPWAHCTILRRNLKRLYNVHVETWPLLSWALGTFLQLLCPTIRPFWKFKTYFLIFDGAKLRWAPSRGRKRKSWFMIHRESACTSVVG